ncbi:protein Rf1, mitochondrial-like [Dorcoceras hygrometricum]|uniref:Protein Rf1, mitochondrial-like n=1 Tax=Dorcoceras hygrometricum TaxID=472368 RepID=A0A2Z7CER0_9LAMI|nr:protein Rf1, mitochondrial-like [Dorcoceras hygrometricum]
MAIFLVQNSLQVNFESVLSLPSRRMMKMFKALESSGLRGFFGCTMVVYEENLHVYLPTLDWSGTLWSAQSGFPERLVSRMRMEFSESGVPVQSSCKKKEMKVEYRLLNDIIAKALTAKAGSFDDETQGLFELMMAIVSDVRINWSKILFRILKAMVVPSTKQAHGIAVQLSMLLEGVTRLKLGESKALPSLKILSVKSAGTYVAKNKSAQEEIVKEKNYNAVKKKRTSIGRAAVRPTVPIQMSRPPKRKIILLEDYDSEDAKPLTKDVRVSAPMTQAVTTLSRMKAKILEPCIHLGERHHMCSSPHDPLGITDSVCKNQFVKVRVQYGPFISNILTESMTIGKSRVARDSIAMHTSWRATSHVLLDSIGPRTKVRREFSTTKHRLLHASGPHPIPPPNDPNRVDKRVKGYTDPSIRNPYPSWLKGHTVRQPRTHPSSGDPLVVIT